MELSIGEPSQIQFIPFPRRSPKALPHNERKKKVNVGIFILGGLHKSIQLTHFILRGWIPTTEILITVRRKNVILTEKCPSLAIHGIIDC